MSNNNMAPSAFLKQVLIILSYLPFQRAVSYNLILILLSKLGCNFVKSIPIVLKPMSEKDLFEQ